MVNKQVTEKESKIRLQILEEKAKILLDKYVHESSKQDFLVIIEEIRNIWRTGFFKTKNTKWKLNFLIHNKIVSINTSFDNLFDIIDVYYGVLHDKEHQNFGFDKIKANKMLVDCGGYLGEYAILMSLKNPKSKILTIEGDPITYKTLRRNIKENNLTNKISAQNFILDSQIHKRIFEHLPLKPCVSSNDISEIFGDRTWYDDKLIIKFPVTTEKLSNIIKSQIGNIDIIKIDMDGIEVEIMKDLVTNNVLVPRIVVEYHTSKSRNDILKLTNNIYECIGEIEERKGSIGNLYFHLLKS